MHICIHIQMKIMTTYYIQMYSHSYRIVSLNKNKLLGLSIEGKIMQRAFAQSVLILYLLLLPGIKQTFEKV